MSVSLKEAFRVFDLTGEGVLTKKYLKFSIMNCGDSSLPEVKEERKILKKEIVFRLMK